MMIEAKKRPMLISLKPRFADAILSGKKTVELRRQRVTAEPGTLIYIYASSPAMALVGTVELSQVIFSNPARIWDCFGHRFSLAKTEFLDYVDSCDNVSALILKRPKTWTTPVSLQELRELGSFHPPQSYRFFSKADLDSVAVAASDASATL